MFPFKAKEFAFEVNLSADDLYVRLKEYSKKWKCISLESNEHHGEMECNKMLRELGDVFFKNSFRPVVVFNWKGVNDKTIVTGYYRIELRIIQLFLVLPLIGIVQAFRYKTIAPVIFFCALWIILQFIFYLLFMKDFDWFQANFKDIINGEFPQEYES
jgi:hypothetical protein